MPTRLLAVVAALAACLPATAQPASHPFFPLAEGNTWVHDVYVPAGHRTTRVLGWEGEGEEAFWRVGVAFAPFSGAPSEGECAVRLVTSGEATYVDVEPLSGHGCGGLELLPALPASGEPEEMWVAGRQHTLTLRSISVSQDGPPTHCTRVAEGVGVVSRSSCGGLFGGGRNLREHLVYAEVDDTTFGTPPDEFFATYDPLQYMPLAVGNRWTYAVESYATGLPPISRLDTYAITGHDPNTGRYDLELVRHVEGEPTATYACRIGMASSGRLLLTGNSACVIGTSSVPGEPWTFRHIGNSALRTYEVAGVPHPLLTAAFSESPPQFGPYDPSTRTAYLGAHGVGLLEYSYSYYNPNPPTYSIGNSYTLRYASVGGVVYGENPLSTERPGSPGAPARAALYPNPASRTAHLSLTLSRPARVGIEVYDVLGRRVLEASPEPLPAGTSARDLDVSGLAAGSYTVRTLVEGAPPITVRLVVLD